MKIILDDISRIDRLITDISDASRLDAELSRAKMEEIDIIELLNKLNDIFKALLAEQNIKIKLLADENKSYRISGISDRLVQVFQNIIDNAVSFSPYNSIITIKVTSVDEKIIISIIDEGPGLSEGAEQDIFKRFYQERPKDEKFGTHSGLGLSISKQIIKVHGGVIKAENVINSFEQPTGACFSIFIPEKIG
jgi:two-component system sensor histidine kinase ChvG